MRNFGTLWKQKKTFLIAVYAVLALQILVSYFSMQTEWAKKSAKSLTGFLGTFLGVLCLILLLSAVPMPPAAKVVVLCAIAALMGVFLRRMADRVSEATMKSAVLGASGVFVAMSVFGLVLASSGVNLSSLGIWLFAALVGIIVAQLVMLFTKPTKQKSKWIVTAVMILFSLYTVYDTNQILQKDYAGDFATASLDFYLDFLNLFTASAQS